MLYVDLFFFLFFFSPFNRPPRPPMPSTQPPLVTTDIVSSSQPEEPPSPDTSSAVPDSSQSGTNPALLIDRLFWRTIKHEIITLFIFLTVPEEPTSEDIINDSEAGTSTEEPNAAELRRRRLQKLETGTSESQ